MLLPAGGEGVNSGHVDAASSSPKNSGDDGDFDKSGGKPNEANDAPDVSSTFIAISLIKTPILC
jgi:hypothetical protein